MRLRESASRRREPTSAPPACSRTRRSRGHRKRKESLLQRLLPQGLHKHHGLSSSLRRTLATPRPVKFEVLMPRHPHHRPCPRDLGRLGGGASRGGEAVERLTSQRSLCQTTTQRQKRERWPLRLAVLSMLVQARRTATTSPVRCTSKPRMTQSRFRPDCPAFQVQQASLSRRRRQPDVRIPPRKWAQWARSTRAKTSFLSFSPQTPLRAPSEGASRS
mmetsp:Transcript_54757/g.130596  ORF Transcript_54757/g.130596 Transcript_54757/m.130596 type:complete len:218 (+) Transcript_54757:1637-2290(+)